MGSGEIRRDCAAGRQSRCGSSHAIAGPEFLLLANKGEKERETDARALNCVVWVPPVMRDARTTPMCFVRGVRLEGDEDVFGWRASLMRTRRDLFMCAPMEQLFREALCHKQGQFAFSLMAFKFL